MAKKKPPKNRHQQRKRQPTTTPASTPPIHPPLGGPFDWTRNLPAVSELPLVTVRLHDLPYDYPPVLKDSTVQLLLQAKSKFPQRSQLGKFCLWFIDSLTR